MKPQPAWLRAQGAIEEMIASSAYAAGEKIPSERRLAEQFGLSRMTVRQAVESLVRVGVLERDSTSGTRVASPSIRRVMDSRHVFSMSQQIRSSGAEPGSRLIYFAQTVAGQAIADRLGIEPGVLVIGIRRLRTANRIPLCVETSYLPAERVRGLAAADLLEDASLYSVLDSRYGLRPVARRSEISVAPVGSEDAELLGLRIGTNVLMLCSVVLDKQGTAIEYVISVNHPERVSFTTEYSAGDDGS
jgi:GntR family transcriptional regulator